MRPTYFYFSVLFMNLRMTFPRHLSKFEYTGGNFHAKVFSGTVA